MSKVASSTLGYRTVMEAGIVMAAGGTEEVDKGSC